VAISADGKRIVSGSQDKTVRVWDLHTGKELLTLKGHIWWVRSVAISRDGRRIVSGSSDGSVKVWDAHTGKELLTLKGHTAQVTSVAMSPDGNRIASASEDHTLKVWDSATGQDLMTLKGHTFYVGVTWSPDGTRIVSASIDGTVKVWHAPVARGFLTLKGHTDTVSSVAISPDGTRIVSGSHDQTVKVHDAVSGQVLLTFEGHTSAVTSLAVSPDGKRIVSAGARGNRPAEIKVWDAQTGQELFSRNAQPFGVSNVVFSPNGKRILSSDTQGRVFAWDARTGDKQLLSAADTLPPGRAPVAIRGNLRVFADGDVVHLEHLPSPGERAEEQRIARILRARQDRDYHQAEVESATMRRQHFAAVFHLDRLLPLLPEKRTNLLARRSAILSEALKTNANDTWASRSLARQVIGDPRSVSDRATLLLMRDALARGQYAPMDRLYGAVLLRTGATKEASLVLRAALRNREGDAPPVEELLLALAHVQRHQPDEARKYLTTAVAWTNRGTQPVRAISLLGLRLAGPLAALSGMAMRPPDPRLVPLDHATAHELASLRAEVEKALARERHD
jgi:DNA-binding beta-propeller fold protein YncE